MPNICPASNCAHTETEETRMYIIKSDVNGTTFKARHAELAIDAERVVAEQTKELTDWLDREGRKWVLGGNEEAARIDTAEHTYFVYIYHA